VEGLTLGKVAGMVRGRLQGAPEHRKVTGLCIDSRRVQSGDLFVALPGRNVDGHDFVASATAAGAAAGLVRRKLDQVPVIQVRDPRKAAGELAAAYRQMYPKLEVAAITGSSGKTTTKEMLAAILGQDGHPVLATEGNLNNDLGLPLTLARLTRRHRRAVLELGMSAAGEIRTLARMCRPRVGIITNIGDAHLGHFKNRRAVARAKCELLTELAAGGAAVLNADDPLLAPLAGRYPGLTFGLAPGADVHIDEVFPGWSGTLVTLRHRGRACRIKLKILGMHQAWNAAAAVAAGLALGLRFEDACRRLGSYRQQAAMRMQLLKLGPHRLIHDAYNSNPQSAAAGLALLAQLPSAAGKFFVAGSMLELGAISEQAHRELGEKAAAAGISGLIAVGREARWIAEAAKAAGFKETVAVDRAGDAARHLLPRLSRKGDVILVKGSRGIGLEACVEELKKAYKR